MFFSNGFSGWWWLRRRSHFRHKPYSIQRLIFHLFPSKLSTPTNLRLINWYLLFRKYSPQFWSIYKICCSINLYWTNIYKAETFCQLKYKNITRLILRFTSWASNDRYRKDRCLVCFAHRRLFALLYVCFTYETVNWIEGPEKKEYPSEDRQRREHHGALQRRNDAPEG